jgi:dipeptidyl aminopeptidase/acylaminoacyl peptidase
LRALTIVIDHRDVPLAVLIHGGPQGSWNNDWSYRWNPQLYLARGYGVVTINPHGSTGFGQAFTDRVSGDWGGAPFQDIMRGVDFVLKNYDWVDPCKTMRIYLDESNEF